MRIRSILVCCSLTVALASPASAQLNQLMRGDINGIPVDLFLCGDGSLPCDLGYRMYSAVDPREINGPANPVDGIPSYRAESQRYRTDTQTTANFPLSSAAGPGNEWFIVWDGITDPGTTDHAGWYGAQSQIVDLGEVGGGAGFNCLPFPIEHSCFFELDERTGFNDTVLADGTAREHIGGISPIPCPSLSDNAMDTLTFAWEQAGNITVADFASEGVTGYDLYLLPDPLAAPTDLDLAAATRAASLPATGISITLDRAVLNVTPGLVGSTTYVAAMKLRYAAGHESLFFSCNSVLTGVATLDAAQEGGDAPANIDVIQAFAEIRRDNLLVVTLVLGTDELLVDGNEFRLRFHSGLDADTDGSDDSDDFDGDESVRLRVRGQGRDDRLVVRFDASFDADLGAFSSIDAATGRVQFVIDAESLTEALGSNQAVVSGLARNRGDRDRFDLGALSF